MMRLIRFVHTAAAIGAAAILWVPGLTATAEGRVVWEGSEPAPGIWFYWYEPSFYVGFAPKSQDPDRAHVELSRGNQTRFTLVLGDDEGT